jgi:hypothetical protein
MPKLCIQVLDDENIVYIEHEVISEDFTIEDIYMALATTLHKGRFTPRYFDREAFVIDFVSTEGFKMKLIGDCGIQKLF